MTPRTIVTSSPFPVIGPARLVYCGAMPKIFCGLLIAVLSAHLQCGGSCLVKPTSTEAPCHKHTEQTPSNDRQPSHQSDGVCNQGSVIQTKIAVDGKLALEWAVVLPMPIAIASNSFALPLLMPENPPDRSPFPVSIPVLRI